MTMIELDAETDRLLSMAAKRAGLTPAEAAREAIIRFIEDIEDARIAEERLAKPGKRIALADLERELGLA